MIALSLITCASTYAADVSKSVSFICKGIPVPGQRWIAGSASGGKEFKVYVYDGAEKALGTETIEILGAGQTYLGGSETASQIKLSFLEEELKVNAYQILSDDGSIGLEIAKTQSGSFEGTVLLDKEKFKITCASRKVSASVQE